VRAFQRAVNEDKVNVVIGSYISGSFLHWSLGIASETPFITPGAASNEISLSVHRDYERTNYVSWLSDVSGAGALGL